MYTRWPQLNMYSKYVYLILLQGVPVASYFKKPQHASENETWVRM